ncbi:hypothetical protein [Aquimarina algiphila]|uniref:Uncharacterized protein n=1 Tax=Aquimarina algiphila TaxID=2047982 RepID=A0A554VDE6_9FLAO|nr:hypothetical protein [Aquimarina algiphila]TSE04871.1 hypothetical protein FOF46_24610 [Aquimarina algiphila]
MNTILLGFAILASGIIGYFISISLVTTPFYKNRANNYLSLSLFLLTSLTLLGWFNIEDTVLEFLNNPVLEYLVGVTLFTYFLIQIEHKYLKQSWYKWLYLPFIGALIIETILYLDTIFNFYNSDFVDLQFHIMDNGSFFFNVFLIFWGRKLIKGSKIISEDKKRWLLRLNLFMIYIIIMWLLSTIEFYVFDSEYATSFLWVLLSFLSWWVLYYGVFRLQLVVQKDEIHQYLVSKTTNSIKTKKKINEIKVSKIYNRQNQKCKKNR